MATASGEQYGLFWNSSNKDRLYNADSFATLFKKFFVTGVFNGELAVTAATGMNVNVGSGFVLMEGRAKEFKDPTTFTLDAADRTYPRIDAIMVESIYQERKIRLKYVKGTTSASTPSAPAPVRDVEKYQIVLAHIYVAAGATSISQSAITDTRMNTNICGYVTGTVDELDWDQITAQFSQYMREYKTQKEGEFDTWAQAKKDAYDAYVANLESDWATWTNEKRTAYLAWVAAQESDYETWSTNEKNQFTSWEAENKQEFEDWFDHMKGQLTTDAAGNLQTELDNLSNELNQTASDLQNRLNTSINDVKNTVNVEIATVFYNFVGLHTHFNSDGSIDETDDAGYAKHTVFNADGSITETLYKDNTKLIKQTTYFDGDDIYAVLGG